ncbi:MAG: N-acetylornithine carbamoyltransferase [Planctomycetes bacterium]|nr:N-acetylornithine carbamoyltransferase [Planctomycetota bacterium]
MARSPRHLISLSDLDDGALDEILELSARLKRRTGRNELVGKTIGMLFFRGSLRTRASLEAAVVQLGGNVINLTAMSDFWELEEREGSVMDGRAPEHIKDAAAVLSRYVHALAIRPPQTGNAWEIDRRDERIRAWAKHATVPVMNMESSLWHPLQSLADLLTLREHLGDLRGQPLAVTWVHSPTPASPSAVHSLLHAALRSGMHVRLAHPPGFELDGTVVSEAEELGRASGGTLTKDLALEEAVRGARVVYARSWQSLETYANPTLAASQRSRHTSWRIDEKLLAQGQDARLMHAMPVRRNVEVTDEVLDGPRSLLYEQAANRLPSQMALLANLLR